MSEFEESEVEALKKIAKERIAYDTLTNKLKSNWIWIVGAGLVTLFVLWEKIQHLIFGVK